MDSADNFYTARAHHILETRNNQIKFDPSVRKAGQLILNKGNVHMQADWEKIVLSATNHNIIVADALTYKADTIGENNQNLSLLVEALINLGEIVYLAQDETILELSAFPTADPICLATCIGKHCQIGLKNLHRTNPEVDDPVNNHDVEIMVRLLQACEQMYIPVRVTQWQYFNRLAYPVRIQIRVGDLRSVVEGEG